MSRGLSRSALRRPAPGVGAVHLGLGAFFRAHQAVYTDLAADAAEWGYAAFTGRSPDLAGRLAAQEGLYSLLRRTPGGDEVDTVGSVAQAHAGGDTDRWLALLADPAVRLLTLTVTEAAYHRDATGGLALDAAEVTADVAALRRGALAECRSVPGRVVAGLAARAAAGGDPLAIVPCDNLPDNGPALRRVVTDLVEAVAGRLDPQLPDWVAQRVSFVSTEVDRITPRTTDADRETVRRLTGLDDACPVVTEPFTEWTLAGEFPAGRPAWEDAGARFVEDVTPYETRKLWLLNGAHSLLAYAAGAVGHQTVAEAVADPRCRAWIEEWWDEAMPHLSLPAEALADYRAALLDRFANPAIRHLLAQIAADGSQKLPVRVLPVVRAERAAGRGADAGARALGGWVAHLRGRGVPVTDPCAEELRGLAAGPLPDGVRRVLATLGADLPDDRDLVTAVTTHAEELSR